MTDPAPVVLASLDVNAGAPTLAGTTRTVREIVAKAYADGHESVLSGEAALSPPELDAVLGYCAARACDTAPAACPGCRLATERAGLATLDDYCRQFSAIHLAASGLTLQPGGPRPTLRAESLEALARDWRGEEVFYLARRVLRRLVKIAAPRPKSLTPGRMDAAAPVVLLVRPQLADNIGMVARAMANFGLEELRLVAPRDGWPNEKARAAASGANAIVDEAAAFPSLEAAVGDLNFVCATTARQRDLAKPVLTPAQAVDEVRARLARGERCGIVFGPERTGLETDEVALADAAVMIPVDSRFASLNVAQAALLLAYEWRKAAGNASLGRVTPRETAIEPGLRLRGSEPATKAVLLGLFEHLEGELERLGFFNPPEKRQAVVRNLRSVLTRMNATEQEVRTLRGIVATLAKGKGHGRKPPV